jgi:hypothetical protein
MVNETELIQIMHALTLQSTVSANREKWLNKGFKRIHKRPGALLDYWKKRLSKNDPDDLILYGKVLGEYQSHMVSLEKEKLQATKPVPATPPTAASMAKSLATSMANWAKQGFKIATPEQLQQRLDICKLCPEWDGNALAGSGRCNVCGCSTQAKLRLATEKCPIDKWGPVT